MPYMTYTQLKNSAKARISPVMGRLVGVVAIHAGIVFFINEIISLPALFSDSMALLFVVYVLSTLIAGTLGGFLTAGSCYLYLKLHCGRPVAVSDLFHAFTDRAKTCAVLSFVMSLFTTVPVLPAYYFSLRASTEMEKISVAALASGMEQAAASLPPELMNDMTISLFCCTPALVIITFVGLVYSQVYYLMWDFPTLSAGEILRRSRLLMRGQKGRLFYVRVCFIPPLLLGMLLCGIGMLWVIPFVCAVEAEFYLDLVTKRGL